VGGHRERRQAQPGHPSLGTAVEQAQPVLREGYPGGSEELAGLADREPQVIGANLGEVTFEPPPVQAELRIMSRHKDDMDPAGNVVQEIPELAQDFRALDFVKVVDHDD
jgi:hypothetical protein